jgi:hypothetical protein
VGTGFSIGLSPASPGFVLVPRERRRRVSGMSVESLDRRPVRRTVSDGDALQFSPSFGDVSATVDANDGEASQSKRSKDRWRWVKVLFGRTRK